jgi:hypothetical protein
VINVVTEILVPAADRDNERMWAALGRLEAAVAPPAPRRRPSGDSWWHCCIEPSRDFGAARSSPELRQRAADRAHRSALVAKRVDLGPDTPVAQEDLSRPAIM